MSKFIISNTNIESANNVLATVSTKDTITELTFGEKDLGDKVLVSLNVTGVGEQVSLVLAAKKPKGWDGTPVTIGVKSQTFQAVTGSLSHFGEEVYIDIAENAVKAGVSGKAEVSLDTVAELPQKIEGGDVMAQFVLKATELNTLIKKGMSTTSDEIREDGTHNAVLTLDLSDGEGRGQAVAFSTTRVTTSFTKGKVLLPKVQEGNEAAAAQLAAMQAVLDAYVEKTKQTKEALTLVLPGASIKHLQSILAAAGLEQVLFSVTEKYIQVALGSVGTYTFRQNPKAPAKAEMLQAVIDKDTEGGAELGFDAATLSNAVAFINDMDRLDGTFGKKAVKLTASAEGLLMISGNGDKARTSVKVAGGSGEAECYVNGAKLRDAINVLDKGNIVLTFGNSTVKVENGTVDNKSGSGFAFIMKAQADTEDDAAGEETAEAESES